MTRIVEFYDRAERCSMIGGGGGGDPSRLGASCSLSPFARSSSSHLPTNSPTLVPMQSTLNPDDTSDALAGVLKLPPLHLTASPLQRGPAPPRGYTTMKITTAEFGEQTGYVELAALSRAQAAAAPPQATSASRLKGELSSFRRTAPRR